MDSDIVLGKHSGRHALRSHLAELGIHLDGAELDEAFRRFKVIADRKKEVTSADLEALVGEEMRERAYAAAPRATYDALKAAAAQMGYRQTRGGAAQGEFEAVSAVAPGDRHGTARQILLKARLGNGPEGRGTLLSVGLSEVIEEDSSNRPGLATRTALRDTPQHEVLFRKVAELLGEPAQPQTR